MVFCPLLAVKVTAKVIQDVESIQELKVMKLIYTYTLFNTDIIKITSLKLGSSAETIYHFKSVLFVL
jgi:hypothetical protein